MNSYNTGNVTGKNSIGGITGEFRDTGINNENCYNLGKIKGTTKVGGLFGSAVWGVVMSKNIYNLGPVEGESEVGGIIGNTDNIEDNSNCFYLPNTATGAVNGTDRVGMTKLEFTKENLLNNLKANVQINNAANTEKWLDWKIDETVNNGYPIFMH